MASLAINTVGDELDVASAFCRERQLGVEITDFAFPQNIEGQPAPRIRHLRDAVSGIAPLISHGPFLDLVANSMDPAIVAVCRRRHRAALEASHAVGASLYIAHTNFNPMIRNAFYRNSFADRMREFWLPFADWAAERGTTICLENLWEPDPGVQAEVVSVAAHPNIKASFDNGHALVFSQHPAANWIETLGPVLAHCHMHDNNRESDEHAVIGEGKEDWPAYLKAVGTWAPQAVLVVECDRFESNQKGIERLERYAEAAAAAGPDP